MTRQELIEQIQQKQSFLCVGLDTDINKIPKSLMNIVKKEYEEEEYTYGMLLEFNTRIIDAMMSRIITILGHHSLQLLHLLGA